jgi:DNA helicase-2/ATP-dependent DNA helicase PcrA
MGELRRSRGTFDEALADLAASVDDAVGTGDRAEERRANVDALLQLARDFASVEGTPTVPAFLSWLSSTTRADQPDRQGDAVEITTFHAAKGLEWPVVHLAGLEQGLVPIGHARTGEALAEELRLFYVAVTRAERELVCSWAASRRYGTRDLRRERSPYLDTLAAACAALRAGTDPLEVGKGAGQVAPAPKPERPHRRSRTRPDLPRAAGALAPADLDDDGRALLDLLRTWRSEKARAAGMPAYVICNDRTLIEIASVRPSTADELLTVHGLGEVKVGRFGDELLALVGEQAG